MGQWVLARAAQYAIGAICGRTTRSGPRATVNQVLATAPKVPSRRRVLLPARLASLARMLAGPLHVRNANVSSESSGSISAGSTRQRRLQRRLQHACDATGRIRGHGDRCCRVTGPRRVMRCLFGGALAGRASRGLGYRRHVPRSGVQSAYRVGLGFSRFISARA